VRASIQAEEGKTEIQQSAIATSLAGFSIEMGSHESDALQKLAHRLPAGTDVFLNLFPTDNLERQLEICRQIRALGFTAIPHLAARRARSRDDVPRVLGRFTKDAGVRDFLFIAGDLEEPANGIRDSLEFIREIRSNDFGIRRAGISGYPEGHPLISDKDLSESQQEKIALLQDLGIEPVVVTQFSFDADAVIRYCNELHSRYPDMQIKNGLPGPAKLTTLIRFAQRCGVTSSMRKMKALPVSTSLRLLQRVPPSRQAEALGKYRLEENGNVAVHLFTFGGLEAALDWIDEEIGVGENAAHT
jgi:methylenetetrahydrofolate reductase (NADPH)